jgi:hypothetical protein
MTGTETDVTAAILLRPAWRSLTVSTKTCQ